MKPPALAVTLLRRLIRDPQALEVVLGDLEEELTSHLAAGRSRPAARLWFWRHALASIVACRSLGRGARRASAGSPWLRGPGWGQDLRHSLRLARQAPSFTAVSLLTLTLGLAGVITVSALLAAILWRPLPYTEPDRLVAVGDGVGGSDFGNTGYATWFDWRKESRSFAELAILRGWGTTLVGDRAEQLPGVRVSSNLLPMLGVEPALGRGFLPAEDQPEHRFVVLLTDGLWRRSFGADPGVLGRRIDLGGTSFAVVGVLPASFDSLVFDSLYRRPEILAPVGYDPAQPWACRSCQHLKVLGRLRAGVSPAAAQADLAAIQARLRADFPLDYASANIIVEPLATTLLGTARPALWVLFAAVVLVLAIACANVASLLLARSAERRREVEIRAALGAPRGRLLRQLLTEAGLLAGVAAGLGTGLAWLALQLIVEHSPARLPRLGEATIDLRVLALAVGVTALTALASGLAPAIGLSRASGSELATGARAAGSRRRAGGRRLLVVVNVALAFVLLVGAGLMLRTVERLLRVKPGFEPKGVLTAQLTFLGQRFADDAPTNAAMEEVLQRVRALPGVEAAALASQVPLGGNFDGQDVEVEGRPVQRVEDAFSLQRYTVTPGYFAALRLPLERGRLLTADDTATSPPVLLVGASAAARLFPGEDALGKRLRFGAPDAPWRTVVGIVGDVRHRTLASEALPAMYLPASQGPGRVVTLVVRARGTQEALPSLAPAIRREVAAVASEVPVSGFAPLLGLAAGTAARERFTSALLSTFSSLALLLATVGLYGLVAFLVEARRREMGIRLALGALSRDIARLVLRPGLGLLAAGLAAGWLIASLASRLLASQLFGIAPHDLATYADITLLLLAAGLLAHVVPLRRACRVEPTVALRGE